MLITVEGDDRGERIDIFVSQKAGISRSQAAALVEKGLVTVNGSTVKKKYQLSEEDSVSITLPESEPTSLVPEDLPVEVMYKDNDLIVVNKPAGMVVYPAAGHSSGTLMNAIYRLAGKTASVGGPLRPGVVHRLDRDTSGVMVVALEDKAYHSLVEQFKNREIKRKYFALILGSPNEDEGTIKMGIGRSSSDRKKMSVSSRVKKMAVTNWTVVKRFGACTLIEVVLETGRTHQIRVHFSAIGHPVLGDSTYGKKTHLTIKGRKIAFNRQMLHAARLGFTHPGTGKFMKFKAPMPDDMKEAIEVIEEALG